MALRRRHGTIKAIVIAALSFSIMVLGLPAKAVAEGLAQPPLPAQALSSLVSADYGDLLSVAAVAIPVSSIPDEVRSQFPADYAVYLISASAADGSQLGPLGVVLAGPDDVFAAVRSPAGDSFNVVRMDLTGNILQQDRVATSGATDCQVLGGALVAAGFVCIGFGGAAVCGAPLAMASLFQYLACSFDGGSTITVHRDTFGVTGCTYGPVSGQFYANGARCDLQYEAERVAFRDLPGLPNAGIRSVDAWLRFHRDDSGLDVGSNTFDNSWFHVNTFINGSFHTIRSRSTLLTGTSTRPRYGRLSLYVSYTDGSFVVGQDGIAVR